MPDHTSFCLIEINTVKLNAAQLAGLGSFNNLAAGPAVNKLQDASTTRGTSHNLILYMNNPML
jgi:hypothetical protein